MAHTSDMHNRRANLFYPASSGPFWSLLGGICCLLAAAVWPHAHAREVFRVVGPDGKVTFTDRPPSAPTAPATPTGTSNATDGSTNGSSTANTPAAASNRTGSPTMPLALRQAMARYPVVLYTGSDCNACEVGRKHLVAQGVPYTEKTVTSQVDAEALQQLSGAQTVPYFMVGKQGLKGYNEAEWRRYLAAAGYPAKSALPQGYQNPAPSPLTSPSPVASPNAAAAAAAAATATAPDNAANRPTESTTVVPVQPRNTNPAGIRF